MKEQQTGSVEVGERLRQLRISKQLKQREIADLLNVTQAAYGKIESGARDISRQTCICLADYYGVTCDFILRGIPSDKVDIAKTLGLTPSAIDALISETNDSYKSRLISEIIASKQFRNDCFDAFNCMECNTKRFITNLFAYQEDILDSLCQDSNYRNLNELKNTYVNGTLLKAARTLINVIESYHSQRVAECRKNQLSFFDYMSNDANDGGEPNAPQD